MEKLMQFYQKVQVDPILQEKLQGMQGKTQEETMDAVIALAKENGFEITRVDLEKAAETAKADMSEDTELSDEALDGVAGGGTGEWVLVSFASLGLGCLASLARGKKCKMDAPPPEPDDGD